MYTVEEERPVGAPPLAPLGFGPEAEGSTAELQALTRRAIRPCDTDAARVGVGGMRLRLDLQPELAEEGVAVGLAAEEVAHEDVAIDAAAALEDLAPVLEPVVRSKTPAVLEAREHVVAEHARPEVAVVAGVVAEQVAEARLEVRALGIGKAA